MANKKTPEEALAALERLKQHGDTELAHSEADDVLCDLIRFFGYPEIAEAFDAIDKWYA